MIYLLNIFALLMTLAQSNKCFENFTLDIQESEVQKEVQTLIFSKQEIQYECLQILIDRGYYKAALELYEGYFMVHKIDIFENVRNQTTHAKKNFNKFTTAMEISNAQVQQIRPVIEWAQSRQFVFLYMKKALRKDAPGCIDCTKDEIIDIQENKLFASSFGIITHQPVQWVLDIEFEGKIDVSKSTYRESGVGTYFFNLTKVDNYTLWEKLDINMAKQPAIWWDMRDKYKKDMDAWIKMVDGHGDHSSKEEDKNESESEIEDGEMTEAQKQQKIEQKKQAKKEEKQLLSKMTKSQKEAYLYKQKLRKDAEKKQRQKAKQERDKKKREKERLEKEKQKQEKENASKEQEQENQQQQQEQKQKEETNSNNNQENVNQEKQKDDL